MEGEFKTCVQCRKQKAEYQRTEVGKAVANKSKAKWRKTENGKRLLYAHVYVSTALRRGKLFKQPCEVCNELKVEAHHPDHDKRLEVRWLCIPHHREVHRGLV